MGNECAGSLSPQADLLGFAAAIIIAASLAMLISGSVLKERDVKAPDVTADDLRSVLEWPGFDPDDDGILSCPDDDDSVTSVRIGTSGMVAALLRYGPDHEGAFLFSDGRYMGKVMDPHPVSRIVSATVLVGLEGRTVPGTLSVFRVGVMQ